MKVIAVFDWLPFQMGVRPSPANAPFPDRLPFQLAREPSNGLIVQVPQPDIVDWLEKMYRVAKPYGTPMDEAGLGRRYADDFMGYIAEAVGPALKSLRLVEIGCGYGYLLKRLLQEGADGMGFEPGPGGARARASGLPVLSEPFNPGRIEGPVDLFVAYGVLEHIQDYRSFLREQRRCLAPGGRLILSVPDCTWSIEKGDISMLVHEHWNYFTADSLQSLASQTGFELENCRPGGVGGTLYSAWRATSGKTAAGSHESARDAFAKRYEAVSKRLKALLDGWTGREKTIGVYVPGRILNYLPSMIGLRLRFFDDDPNLTGRYYPPFDFPIETRADLLAKPVDCLLVMSTSFGPQIAETLKEEAQLKEMEIALLGDIFS